MRHLPDISPKPETVDKAWREYAALVVARNDNPALANDVQHSMDTARAWSRWQSLFLARDAA